MNPEYQKILGTRRAFMKGIWCALQNRAALPSSTSKAKRLALYKRMAEAASIKTFFLEGDVVKE
jgi:hypothetical protein